METWIVPSEPRVRGPAAPTAGRLSRRPTRVSTAPGVTSASGLRKRTCGARDARQPWLQARANPTFSRVGDDEGLRVARAHGVGGPVRAGVVDHDELEGDGGVSAQGVEAGEQRLARLEGHDHDRQPGRVAHRPAASSRSARVLLRGLGPRVAGGQRVPRGDEGGAEALVREHPVEGRRHRGLVAGVHEERGAAEDLAQRGRAADDEGHAAGGGLEGRKAEALVLGEEDRGVGGGVAVGERRLVDEAGEADVGLEAERPDHRREVDPRVRAVLADHVQDEAGAAAARGGRRRAAAPARSGGSGPRPR